MALRQKTIKIGDHDITIRAFPAIEGWKLRAKLSNFVKTQLSISEGGMADIIKGGLSIMYEMPIELIEEVLSKCTSKTLGELKGDVFNEVFSGNLDDVNKLVVEVIDFNNFFTKKLFISLMDKFPMLKILGEKGKGLMDSWKTNQDLPEEQKTALKDLMTE